MKNTYDVFISHATKDKEDYVNKLYKAMRENGLSVFYDTESITWGDSISECIETGLENCKLAVIVISENYFERSWTEYELRTLLNRQSKEGRRLIMPILHNISKKQRSEHYPELADISYLYSKSCSCEEMARRLAARLDK